MMTLGVFWIDQHYKARADLLYMGAFILDIIIFYNIFK